MDGAKTFNAVILRITTLSITIKLVTLRITILDIRSLK
jgi:hypothetical protein